MLEALAVTFAAIARAVEEKDQHKMELGIDILFSLSG